MRASDGVRRVGDADVIVCLRTLRPSDKYLELYYEGNAHWRKCFVTYSVDNQSKWRNVKMEMHTAQAGFWFHRVEILTRVEFAFTDGGEEWDNNDSKNYSVFMPGKYVVHKGQIRYCGPSDLDRHLY